MHAALEGRPVDMTPVAPLFWGAEYRWKLTGLSIWEVLHGPGDMTMKLAEALDDRHASDWVFLTHTSSHALLGKSLSREDRAHIYFTDDATGNILPFLDTISKMGYDAILPEERIKGVEIDIAEVRKALGPDACIFTNFDSYLLLDGDRGKIASEVKRQVREAGPKSMVMSTGSPVCDATDPDVLDFWIAATRGAVCGDHI